MRIQLFTWLMMAAVLLVVASAGNIPYSALTYKQNKHVSKIFGQRFHCDLRMEIKKFDYSIPHYVRRLNPPTSSFQVMTCILLVIAVFSTQTAVFKSSAMSLMQNTRARGNTKKTDP